MPEGAADLTVVDNPEESRYEARIGDELAGLTVYETAPGRVIVVHTEVEPQFEGRGVGSRLAAAVLDDLRARGLGVTPRCPFVAAFIRHHPEYADMVVKENRSDGGRRTP